MKAIFYFFLGFWASAALAQENPKIVESQERLENLRAEILRVEELLKLKESAQNDAAFALKKSTRAQKVLEKGIATLNVEKSALLKSTENLALEMRRGEARYFSAKNQLADLIAAQYMAGQPNYLALVLKGKSPNAAARLHSYWENLNHAHTAALDKIKEEIYKQEKLAQNLEEEKIRLESLEENLRQKEAAVKDEKAAQETLLKRIQNEVTDHKKNIVKLRNDEKNLSNLLKELQKLSQKTTVAKFEKGALIWPLKGKIEGKFGAPTPEGNTWNGVFIHKKIGSHVRATAAGQVVFADWMRGFGMLVIVDHGGSYLSIYGHNDEILKSVGDEVGQGEVLAYSGQNVENAQSGVYFELRHKGKPIDPFLWIKK